MTRTGLLTAALVCCFAAMSFGSGQLRWNRDAANCEQFCDGVAARVMRACQEFGGTDEECAERARQAREQCMNITCGPSSDCAGRCIREAKGAFKQCLADGGDLATCGEQARQQLHECLEQNCHPMDKCKQRCAAQAREAYHACIEMGGSEDECAARARNMYERCVEEHCAEPPTCIVRCVEEGKRILRDCLATSTDADPAQCIARALDFVVNCIVDECSFPVNCENRCVHASARVYHACRDFGGTKAACATRACEFLPLCLEQCDAVCGGIVGLPCEEGEFCKFPPGQCDFADNLGLCTTIPEVCPEVYDPVCGCDGVTYGNACEADAAAVSIDHPGECSE